MDKHFQYIFWFLVGALLLQALLAPVPQYEYLSRAHPGAGRPLPRPRPPPSIDPEPEVTPEEIEDIDEFIRKKKLHDHYMEIIRKHKAENPDRYPPEEKPKPKPTLQPYDENPLPPGVPRLNR